MKTAGQIEAYVASQAEPKRSDMRAIHRLILHVMPGCKMWFLDGKDADGKTVSNPNVGYGTRTMKYANGKTREFYQIGLSANTTGLSVYILGLEDKALLPREFGPTLGKASVSGYCIKFKTLKDIDVGVLESAIRNGVAASNG